MFIAPLLATAAAGYWVLERAEHQKGRTREIGRIVAGLILVLSVAGVACRLYATAKYCRASMGCPMKGYSGMLPDAPDAPPMK